MGSVGLAGPSVGRVLVTESLLLPWPPAQRLTLVSPEGLVCALRPLGVRCGPGFSGSGLESGFDVRSWAQCLGSTVFPVTLRKSLSLPEPLVPLT